MTQNKTENVEYSPNQYIFEKCLLFPSLHCYVWRQYKNRKILIATLDSRSWGVVLLSFSFILRDLIYPPVYHNHMQYIIFPSASQSTSCLLKQSSLLLTEPRGSIKSSESSSSHLSDHMLLFLKWHLCLWPAHCFCTISMITSSAYQRHKSFS